MVERPFIVGERRTGPDPKQALPRPESCLYLSPVIVSESTTPFSQPACSIFELELDWSSSEQFSWHGHLVVEWRRWSV